MSRAHDNDKKDDKDKDKGLDARSGRRGTKTAPSLTHLSDHYAVDSAGQAYTVAMGQVSDEVEGVAGVKSCVLLTPIDVQVVEAPKPALPERPEPEPTPTPMPARG